MDKEQLDLQKQIIREEYITEVEVNKRATEIIETNKINGYPGLAPNR